MRKIDPQHNVLKKIIKKFFPLSALAIVGFVSFGAVMLGLYVVPLAIKSPCICAEQDLPLKPNMFAHRGSSAVSILREYLKCRMYLLFIFLHCY